MSSQPASFAIRRPEDVFALRQSGRVAAAVLGCDEADQVRLATALSELGREALLHRGKPTVTFALEPNGTLAVSIDRFPRAGLTKNGAVSGFEAARKLLDTVSVLDPGESSDVVTVLLRRAPPRRHPQFDAQDVYEAIRRTAVPQPLEELRLENRDLIASLSEVRAKQDELLRLNAELEETNRGVMAMYAQLAEELEETNRGVVALYAELDDKSARLNEANEAKSRFLANASHELRSPVNSILGLVRLLLDPDAGALSEDQRKQLRFIMTSSTELLKLVNDLLDLAKAEAGKLQPDVSEVRLEELFSELRGSLRPLARPGVALVVESPEAPVLETDRILLMQVLRNLASNALKFTSEGEVRIFARNSSPYEIEITVRDTGVGIAPEDQAKVFEEFFQVRGPLQVDQKGSGLGLPYARRVSRALGGDITLVSEVGKGSTFTVRLPVRWQALLRAPQSPAIEELKPLGLGTVLVVDDDDGFRTALRGMLQGIATQVLEARSGREGLELMRSAKPAIAFVDLQMPDIDGGDVLAEMNADPNLRSIPIVIVTSTQLNVRHRARLGLASSLLSKSELTRATIHRVVSEVLETVGAST